MKITLDWLKAKGACRGGVNWFRDHFPDGGERNDVLQALTVSNGWYGWLLSRTLKEEPLPDDWVFSQIRYIDLSYKDLYSLKV